MEHTHCPLGSGARPSIFDLTNQQSMSIQRRPIARENRKHLTNQQSMSTHRRPIARRNRKHTQCSILQLVRVFVELLVFVNSLNLYRKVHRTFILHKSSTHCCSSTLTANTHDNHYSSTLYKSDTFWCFDDVGREIQMACNAMSEISDISTDKFEKMFNINSKPHSKGLVKAKIHTVNDLQVLNNVSTPN